VHAQRSWLGALRSSWAGNRGVNGSALLLVEPVGISQLQDCSFESNQQREGERGEAWDQLESIAQRLLLLLLLLLLQQLHAEGPEGAGPDRMPQLTWTFNQTQLPSPHI
jgi:hypothetical protein